MGGVVWGIGMALHEETLIDHAFGRIMNANIAEYHVPVNADIHDIEVIFVEEPDESINPLGIKGVGEIGIVGVAAAIANAIYHATGKRVRDLPITLDKLLGLIAPSHCRRSVGDCHRTVIECANSCCLRMHSRTPMDYFRASPFCSPHPSSTPTISRASVSTRSSRRSSAPASRS